MIVGKRVGIEFADVEVLICSYSGHWVANEQISENKLESG